MAKEGSEMICSKLLDQILDIKQCRRVRRRSSPRPLIEPKQGSTGWQIMTPQFTGAMKTTLEMTRRLEEAEEAGVDGADGLGTAAHTKAAGASFSRETDLINVSILFFVFFLCVHKNIHQCL
jgi:hypothetical protein